MQAIDPGGGLAESAFRLVRLVLEALIFLAAVAAARWGIRTFLLNRRGLPDRRLYRYSAANLAALVLLLLLQVPADRLLTALGGVIGHLRPESELGWLGDMLVGIYYAVIASLILFLAIHF